MYKLFILIIAGALAAGCGIKPEPQAEKPAANAATAEITLSAKAISNAGITTGKPTQANVPYVLKVNGIVDVPPKSLVSISFPIGGYLKSTNLLPGAFVQQGQVIAQMENEIYVQLQQDYLQAKAKLELLQAEYDRQKELAASDASSRKNFQQAKTDFEVQQITLNALREKLLILGVQPANLRPDNLSRTVPIKSPITGYVQAVHVNVGKYVNPADVLFEIVDPRDLHGALQVFEKDIYRVKAGQPVVMYSTANPEKRYPGKVILVAKNIGNERSAMVHCHFASNPTDLLPGMFITAEISLGEQLMTMVPESALVRHQGKYFVFVVAGNGRFIMTEVQRGEKKDDLVAISALQTNVAQAEIVLTNAYALLGKMLNTGEEE
jgi:cobalt-zinc-cadmium efflux system membrane fusion protein